MTPAQEKQLAKKESAKKAKEAKDKKPMSDIHARIVKNSRLAPTSSLALKKQREKLAAIAKEQEKQSVIAEQNAKAKAIKNNQLNDDVPVNHETATIKLEQDKKQLKGLSVQNKIELKEGFIPGYMKVLNDYRDSGKNYANDVLVTIVIWMLDCNMIDEAMEWGALAIEQGQRSPAGFKRDLTTVVAESLYLWAENQFKNSVSADPYFSDMLANIESNEWLISELIVESKICKLAGNIAIRAEYYEVAVKWYTRCMEVNPEGGGSKTALEKAEKALEKKQASAE